MTSEADKTCCEILDTSCNIHDDRIALIDLRCHLQGDSHVFALDSLKRIRHTIGGASVGVTTCDERNLLTHRNECLFVIEGKQTQGVDRMLALPCDSSALKIVVMVSESSTTPQPNVVPGTPRAHLPHHGYQYRLRCCLAGEKRGTHAISCLLRRAGTDVRAKSTAAIRK